MPIKIKEIKYQNADVLEIHENNDIFSCEKKEIWAISFDKKDTAIRLYFKDRSYSCVFNDLLEATEAYKNLIKIIYGEEYKEEPEESLEELEKNNPLKGGIEYYY